MIYKGFQFDCKLFVTFYLKIVLDTCQLIPYLYKRSDEKNTLNDIAVLPEDGNQKAGRLY